MGSAEAFQLGVIGPSIVGSPGTLFRAWDTMNVKTTYQGNTMDAQALLQQLLARGQEMANQGKNIAEEKLNIPGEGAEREAMLNGMGKGALAAGALALLLGTKAGRRVTGTGLKLGSLAAIGGLGYQAWKQWQQQQGAGAPEAASQATPINELPAPQANERAEKLLHAMITAARADGHIDVEEQGRIRGQIEKLGLDSETSRFLLTELDGPADPGSVAVNVASMEEAAEIYLASLYVTGDQSAEERLYLDNLASALNLPATLVAQLEAEMAA